MKIDWVTDPHLDKLPSREHLFGFIDRLHRRNTDALFVTGDISESPSLPDFLEILAGSYRRPVYFVLGNHDYCGAWMRDTQERVRDACSSAPRGVLNWLPDCGVTFLTPSVALIGHGGMYDAHEGPPGVTMSMGDLYFPNGIYDLADALARSTRHLFDRLDALADGCSNHVEEMTARAVHQGARKVILLTHVPPFLEASYFRGKPSDEQSRPWYVNKTLGIALLRLAEEHPRVEFVCLAGHTHSKREVRMRANLRVRVGSARYGHAPRFVQLPLQEL